MTRQPPQLVGTDKSPPNHNMILKFSENPKSFRSAINAKCAECVGCSISHLEPNWRKTVQRCQSFSCPLFPMRMGAKAGDHQKWVDAQRALS